MIQAGAKGVECGLRGMGQKEKKRSEKPSSCIDENSPFSEPVGLPIRDSIDLHPVSPKDIPSVAEEYLEQWRRAGIYEIRLIHGRGKGIQRHIIRSLLDPLVLSYKDASPESSGWGATLVTLTIERERRKKKRRSRWLYKPRSQGGEGVDSPPFLEEKKQPGGKSYAQ